MTNDEFQLMVSNISDPGLRNAVFYSGAGDVAALAMKLDADLQKVGLALTSYQTQRTSLFSRCWAVYQRNKGRPYRSKNCMYCTDSFNSGKTVQSSAYRELTILVNKLKNDGIIDCQHYR